MIAYHGTFSDFDEFKDTEELGWHFGSEAQANNRITDVAKSSSTREAFMTKWDLDVHQPYIINADLNRWDYGHIQRAVQIYDRYVKLDEDEDATRKFFKRIGTTLRKGECGECAEVANMFRDALDYIRNNLRGDIHFLRQYLIDNGYDHILYKNAVENHGKDNRSIILLDKDLATRIS